MIPYEKAQVQKWLQENDTGEYTELMWSCIKGQLQVCRWLFNNGQSNNIKEFDSSGKNIMHNSCIYGHLLICQWVFMLVPEFLSEVTTEESWTPMLLACANGHIDICEWLFENGANEDIREDDRYGNTPLFISCARNQLPVCKWLLAMGASDDVCQTNYSGRSPLYWACSFGHLEVAQWLYQNGADQDIDKKCRNNVSPMWIACFQGRLSVCLWLQKMGALIDIHSIRDDFEDLTPLNNNCKEGNEEMCMWILQQCKRRPRECDNYGRTPMYFACTNGMVGVCQKMFDLGACVFKSDDNGNCPMAQACWNGHLEVCEWLYSVGASSDVNRKNIQGDTPLAAACYRGHLHVCVWLLEVNGTKDIAFEANSNRQRKQTPILNAFAWSQLPICKWFIVNGFLNGPDKENVSDYAKDLVMFSTTEITRNELKAWSEGLLNTSELFFNTILMGTCYTEDVRTCPSQRPPELSLLRAQSGVLKNIADFLGGVLGGKELGNVRQFASIYD